MCFYISKAYPDAIVAKKDIRVYKRLNSIYFKNGVELKGKSPYQGFWWKAKKLVRSKIIVWGGYSIDEGLHVYLTLRKANRAKCYGEYICEFIIPAGAKYYIHPSNEEIVSNKMYWTGRIRGKDRWKEVPKNIAD